MLKESISIKNFGALRDVQIDEIKKLTIFVGDSGAGKSTIMKVIALFQWIYKRLCIRSYLKQSGVIENVEEFNFKRFLRFNGISSYLKPETEIIYSKGNYQITYKSGKLNTSFMIKQEDISLEKMSYISEKRNMLPNLITNPFSYNLIQDFYLSQTFEDFVIAVNETDCLKIPSVNISFLNEKGPFGKHRISVTDENNEYKIPLTEASSGIQNVTPLFLIIDYYANKYNMTENMKRTIKKYMFESDIIEQFSPKLRLSDIADKNIHLHIEEPELSLYPDGQIKLMEDLFNLCFKKNKDNKNFSLIVSTHSPYIMNYLNLAIKNRTLEFDDIGAFQVIDGEVFSLMRPNNQIVDTRSLSDPINRIYEKYNTK